MDDSVKRFLQRLEAGPAVLLLGQRHLAAETGEDPLLNQLSDKFGPLTTEGYSGLLGLRHDGSEDEFLAWMDERSRRLPGAGTLQTIADFAWSSVITSA